MENVDFVIHVNYTDTVFQVKDCSTCDVCNCDLHLIKLSIRRPSIQV